MKIDDHGRTGMGGFGTGKQSEVTQWGGVLEEKRKKVVFL